MHSKIGSIFSEMAVAAAVRFLKIFIGFWPTKYTVIGCLHDSANVQHQHVYFEFICWKFAGHLLDRVNTP